MLDLDGEVIAARVTNATAGLIAPSPLARAIEAGASLQRCDSLRHSIKTDLAISRPIVEIDCIDSFSESWSLKRRPYLWHSRARGGAFHSINTGQTFGCCWIASRKGGPLPELCRWSHVRFGLHRDVASDRAGRVEHVGAHAPGRFIPVSLSDGVQNGLMLLPRATKPACVT